MKSRWLSFALIVGLLLGALVAPVSAQSQTAGLTASVAGDVPTLVGGSYRGTLTITGFDKQGSGLVANATLDAIVSDPHTPVIGNIRRFAAGAPVYPATGSACDSLNLKLDTVYVHASGFDFKVEGVGFQINAKDYPGNKQLGKLLCKVAKELEKKGSPSAIANELNHILREIRS